MAWVTPPTFVSGNVLTAAQLNILSGDLNETAVAKASAGGQLFVSTAANALAVRTPANATVLTSETTASTTFANLATVGPSVTVTTGTSALVIVSCEMSNNTIGGFAYSGHDITGSSGIPADSSRTVNCRAAATNTGIHASFALHQGSLIAGSSTFKMMYQISAAGTGAFQNRTISVVPF